MRHNHPKGDFVPTLATPWRFAFDKRFCREPKRAPSLQHNRGMTCALRVRVVRAFQTQTVAYE
jgi:hypothetical protein